jgi:hypothetical protein
VKAPSWRVRRFGDRARAGATLGGMDPRPVRRWLAPAAAVVVAAAAVAPWTLSGSAERNSFATVRSARLLGLGDHPVIAALLAAWYFVPALAGLACLAAILHRGRLAGIASAVVGAAALAAGAAVLRSPLAPRAGVWVALVAGLVALAGGAVLVRTGEH